MKINGFTWYHPLDTIRMDSRKLQKNTFYMSQDFKDRLADADYIMCFPLLQVISNRMDELTVCRYFSLGNLIVV